MIFKKQKSMNKFFNCCLYLIPNLEKRGLFGYFWFTVQNKLLLIRLSPAVLQINPTI